MNLTLALKEPVAHGAISPIATTPCCDAATHRERVPGQLLLAALANGRNSMSYSELGATT